MTRNQANSQYIGWFADTGQTPEHDPKEYGLCPVCSRQVGRHSAENPLKTISIMKVEDSRSFFFRTHKLCWESIDQDEQNAIESSIIDK
jgi:hypothetical protein